MQKSLIRKGLVVGIIILFVGASIVPTTLSFEEKDDQRIIERSDEWWNIDWHYRKKITINHTMVDVDLTNFPVLISNTSLDFAEHAQSDGDDFVFVSEDNTTKYNHEIEHYDNYTGNLTAWVNVTYLNSSSDTSLYMYYGNFDCSNQENIEGTWSSDYTMVQHFEETYGIHYDSTSNNHDSSFVQVTNQNAVGKIAGADDFESGNLDNIEFPDSPDWDFYNNPLTISFWVKMESHKNMKFLQHPPGFILYFYAGTNELFWAFESGNTIMHPHWDSNNDIWYYITVTRIANNHHIYINGVEIASVGNSGSFPDGSSHLMISNTDMTIDGIMDEVRILNVGRSYEWILTEYFNQKNPESFIIVGEEEENMIFVDDDFNESTPGWQINHFDSIQDGIDAVSENWTVYVYNGTYYENVDITKNRITLIGEDRNSTIIIGSGGNDCILAVYTNNVTIQGFTLRDSIQGIKVVESYDFFIEDCIFRNNLRGVYLHVSERMTIYDCHIYNNTEEGILIVNCDYSEIYNCNINDNTGTGISLEQHYTGICTENRIYQNNLINNTINAFDDNEDTSNHWYLLYGNYYNDYIGEDSNGDGIGDTPYDIPGGNNQDLYPLMELWEQISSLDAVYVNDDFDELTVGWGYNRFDNIHDGINAVLEHGTVFVYNGIYTEDLRANLEYVKIDKSLDLVGENKITTIINCPSGDTGIWIAPGLSNVNVSRFTILGANNTTTRGIYPQTGSNNIRIKDCMVLRFDEGISVINSNYDMTLSENTIYECADVGVILDNSNNCIISYNIITGNNDGIRLGGSNSNVLEFNTIIENNKDGIWFGSSVDNTISYNNISLNYEDNIQIGGGSNDNIITNNNISSSEWGTGLIVFGDDNHIYHNNLVDNAQNAGDDGYGNTWDDGYPSGGNYWSDYTGEDGNGDGIGDTPHDISGTAGSQDLYPYMLPDGWLGPQNQPPYVPGNPNPGDNETDVSIDADLSWTGGDPDGDPVTYDVYFGDTSPPPQIAWNHTDTTYELDTLDYETTYYWMIVSWDNHSASAEGPIWEFTTEEEYIPVPDLDCSGDLHWTDVQPGATVTEEITVENIGESFSLLDWEIAEYPDWGTWTFTPMGGEDLTPEDSPHTVNVEVVAPDVEEETFVGHVTIVNTENSSDYCIIDVSLATPVSQHSLILQFLERIMERFPNAFPILRLILEL